jgi:hypothetical protein
MTQTVGEVSSIPVRYVRRSCSCSSLDAALPDLSLLTDRGRRRPKLPESWLPLMGRGAALAKVMTTFR